MKKIIPLAVCIFCVTKFAAAQSFHAGVKAGANLQKIGGIPFKDKFTFGYQAGAFAQIGLNAKLGIQPEVLFSSVYVDSAKQFSEVYGFKNINKINLMYLDIPVLLNIKACKFLMFQVGPQFSTLLNKNKNLLKNGEDAFKNNNIAAVGGVQVNLTKIKLYARFVAGINDINNVNNESRWKNQNIQVGVGYKIF